MNQDLLRIIDSICRDKNIEREVFVTDLENAMASAIRKAYVTEDATVKLDPLTGAISATCDGKPLDMHALGRIAAQTAKQVIIQKTRERERTSIFEDFTERRGTIMTGTVVRAEGGNLLVNLGRAEGFLPRSEQIPGEAHQPGERIRALILEVREQPNQVKIILSRSHPEFVIRLFELEVPEVAERIIEIRALAREAGYRTKVAVSSIDSKVDAVGACVGVRGSRIKNVVDELGGEKIDIVRWNESSQILIQNALKPADVQEIALCLELGKATVVVPEESLSLAIGKRGQNVRLAARLTNWDIDILTPNEYNEHLETLERVMRSVPGVDDVLIDKLIAMGCVSVQDVDDLGPQPLVDTLELEAELADKIAEEAGEEVIRQEEAKEAAEKARKEAAAKGLPAEPAKPSGFVPEGGEAPAAGDMVAANLVGAADADEAAAAGPTDLGVSDEAAEATGEAAAEQFLQDATDAAGEMATGQSIPVEEAHAEQNEAEHPATGVTVDEAAPQLTPDDTPLADAGDLATPETPAEAPTDTADETAERNA